MCPLVLGKFSCCCFKQLHYIGHSLQFSCKSPWPFITGVARMSQDLACLGKTHQRPCDYHLLMFVQPLPFSMVATSNQSSKSEPIQKLIFPTFFNQLSFRGLFFLLNFCFQCSSKFECQFRSYVIRLRPLHGQTYINIYICKYIHILLFPRRPCHQEP